MKIASGWLQEWLHKVPLVSGFFRALGTDEIPPPRAAAASAALRATGLLRGGVSAARVWQILGSEPDAQRELREIAQRIAAGASSTAALAAANSPEWRVLAAAWQLATYSGAPFAAVLERIAVALTSLARLSERRSVLLAGPKATIRLLATLPFIAVLIAFALGFDPFGVLFSTAGAVVTVLGVGLLVIGMWWASQLTRQLADSEWVAGLECELTWVALSGGGDAVEAVRRVADSVDTLQVEWVKFTSLGADGVLREALARAANLGTPVGPMLLAEAEAARTRVTAQLEREAERLGVRVLLPLGVCVLPAFVLLGVMPVLIAVLGSIGLPGMLSGY